jgi:hypothetical protein
MSLFADWPAKCCTHFPLFLKEIGFLSIGVFEGLAEFTTGLSKGYFRKLSDECLRCLFRFIAVALIFLLWKKKIAPHSQFFSRCNRRFIVELVQQEYCFLPALL